LPATLIDKDGKEYNITKGEDGNADIKQMEISNYTDVSTNTSYLVQIYKNGNLDKSINTPIDISYTKEDSKKKLDLKIEKDNALISAKWYVNGNLEKQDSIVQIGLSEIKNYDIVVRGVNDSVLIKDKQFTDTLVMFNLSVSDKVIVKIELDNLAIYNSGRYYAGEFGFDVNTPAQVKNAKSDYRDTPADAYMSFTRGQEPAKMKLNVTSSSFPKNYKIELKGDGLTILPRLFTEKQLKDSKDGEFKFIINPSGIIDNGKLQIIGSDGYNEDILYEINYSVKDKASFVKRKLQLLYVITSDSELNNRISGGLKDNIENQLNNLSYNQTFTDWDVKAETIDVRDDISKSLRMQEMYNRYNALRNAYPNTSNKDYQEQLLILLEEYGYPKDQAGYNKYMSDCNPNLPEFSLASRITSTGLRSDVLYDLYKIYTNKYPQMYLGFIFNRERFSDQSFSVPGAASKPNDGCFSSIFLYAKTQNNLYVFTHELGHNLGLSHPSEEFGIPEANTLNYMDYNPNANMFWYWQWKIIQNANISDKK